MRRRILWLVTCAWLMFAALIGRLFDLMSGHDGMHTAKTLPWAAAVATRADLQRMLLLETDDGRGRILFRNGYPWSGVWHPVSFGPTQNALRVGVHHEEKQPASSIPVIGRVGLPDDWPDPKRDVAEQGRSGLEYAFDRVLNGKRPGFVGMLKDVHGKPQPGLRFSIQPVNGVYVRTTVDPLWQRTAEKALSAANVQHGAVVVLDVPTNGALAMASRNAANPDENLAVHVDIPGSVFKLVTAAAAFESYRFTPENAFRCNGSVHIPGVRMQCWRVHGKENLLEAIAQSCDVAFANIGVSVHRGGFDTMADKLHLTSPQLQTVDGRLVLPDAQSGVVFRHGGGDAGLLANTAIGQEDVRVSPLQAANLARTVAAGGWMKDVQLVRDAERGQRVVRAYESDTSWQAMSPSTADKLRQGMTMAVTMPSGTAHLLSQAGVSVAAKTGTAERADGTRNGWIVGFAPADHPQIAFCVFAGGTSTAAAHNAVRQTALQLLGLYRQIHP